MRVFKVVKNSDGHLLSAKAEGKAQVEYVPKVWTGPPKWLERKGHFLLVFRDILSAYEWFRKEKRRNPKIELWIAEADWPMNPPRFSDKKALALGKIKRLKEVLWPGATIAVRSLKLIKKVKI